jgi:hypothetical protein
MSNGEGPDYRAVGLSTLRWAIIAGVIASMVFVWFIQPILRFVWGLTLALGVPFSRRLLDYVYANAALGNRNWVDFLLFGAVLSLMIGFETVMLFSSLGVGDKVSGFIAPKLRPRKKLLKVVHNLIRLAFICYALMFLIAAFSDLQLNASFQQRLAVLAPHIDEQTEETLRASWASMIDHEDYARLNSEMEDLAQAAGVTLPKPLLN